MNKYRITEFLGMDFHSFMPGIEVNGITIMSVVDGMGLFKSQAIKLFFEEGLGEVIADEDLWYDQQLWLNVFKILVEKAGTSTLFMIGMKIPNNAMFPSGTTTIQEGLKSIDIAYHMNHRNSRKEILYNHETGEKLPGIGNYHYQEIDDHTVHMVCENPYPDEFDHGIITAIARNFNPEAQVEHDDTARCRNRGDRSCTYSVTW